ncbi:MAG: ATP-binding cassette domain-containing protein, partial [Verrucomicrobiales bacterium]|nr:ATP-binding cassette domain-containing protein [Verrucomicrobiales bacterium]
SRAGLPKEELITFYQFMTTLGVASEAINIVYQLNTSEWTEEEEEKEPEPLPLGTSQPLETLILGRRNPADVVLNSLSPGLSVVAFRFQNLVLIKNIGTETVIARGRRVNEGEFCRIYEGQRLLLGTEVLDYQDLVFFFNAKKDVSAVQLFLAQDGNGSQFIERVRSKQSYLEVRFGLDIEISVLNDIDAQIEGKRLKKGVTMLVGSKEKLIFDDNTEITFGDLRKRARALGGRFSLLANRSEYLVSNNPNLLNQGDILLTPGLSGDLLLRIRFDNEAKTGEMKVITADRAIHVEGVALRSGGKAELKDGDAIRVGEGQYLRCHFAEGIIEEERNVINTLKVRDVSHSFDRRTQALDAISFTVQRGEMVCVMGPSGCGKSTLLKALGGQLKPSEGLVELNNVDLYEEHENLTSYIALIPQEETFDPLLSVEENLDTAAAIRAPHFTSEERRRRADAKLVELGLNEIRHRLAGDGNTKNLSGGQRRRLNAGMDMIGIADVYLFDEPTSGLSSKDSEHVLEVIRGLTQNKITLISIHQPSSRLFHMFDKAILLDNGGKLAFFGTPSQMLEYFAEARDQEGVNRAAFSLETSELPLEIGRPVSHQLTPDFVFDVLETPLHDLSGDVIYEQNERGHLIPARRFSPAFWADRFQTYRLLQEVNLREIEPDSSATVQLQRTPQRPKRTFQDDWVRFVNQLKRAFWSKLRNRANLATTLLEAPALASLVAVVLRYSEEKSYDFASAFHIPTYLFLSLVIALFLGLTNSAEEIIRDRNMLERERHQGIRVSSYIISKFLSLCFFSLIQCVIYLLIADAILEIRSMFFYNLFWMFGTSIVGVAAGLFISSIVASPKTAANIIPLIMIPNIILGGALIKYDEMNRQALDFLSASAEDESELKVPAICQLMPLRWSYEAMIISHAEHNPVSALDRYIENELEKVKRIPHTQKLTEEQATRHRNALTAKPFVTDLKGATPGEVSDKVKELRADLEVGVFDYEKYDTSETPDEKLPHTSEKLYLNQKVYDLFKMAEFERTDHRKSENPPNVFFGSKRQYRLPFEIPGNPFAPEIRDSEEKVQEDVVVVDTLKLNTIAIAVFVIVALLCLHGNLTRQLKRV